MRSRQGTHYCSRCDDHAPLDEWSYDPERNRWSHIRQLQGVTDKDGNPVDMECGWSEKVPRKVA